MGCCACNPLCGKCKPGWRTCVCPGCGRAVLVTREEYISSESLHCRECGADVTALIYVEPVLCANSRRPCAYPCGRRGKPWTEATIPCILNCPPKACRLKRPEGYRRPEHP